MSAPKLTESQYEMLRSAERWTDAAETDGVGPRGAGEFAQCRALEKRGLLVYVGEGPHMEGKGDGSESAIYAITDAGRAALRGES